MDINEITSKIVTEATESEDEFIFTTIKPWCEEKMQRKISKRDLENALKMYFALEQEPTWIPVSERLPKKSGLYLVSMGDLVTTLSFCGHGFRTHFADEYSVDAWMPFPEAYKTESEDKE